MKKIICVFVVVFSVTVAFAKAGDTMYVNVKTTNVKNGTGALSSNVGVLSYGDKISVLAENGKWTQVSNGSVSGWVPASSLTKKQIVLQNGKGVSASTDELALAGKGFSAEVENVYKHDNNSLRYDLVDKVETANVRNEKVISFIEEGKLSGGR